jgi:hypothetical protein
MSDIRLQRIIPAPTTSLAANGTPLVVSDRDWDKDPDLVTILINDTFIYASMVDVRQYIVASEAEYNCKLFITVYVPTLRDNSTLSP